MKKIICLLSLLFFIPQAFAVPQHVKAGPNTNWDQCDCSANEFCVQVMEDIGQGFSAIHYPIGFGELVRTWFSGNMSETMRPAQTLAFEINNQGVIARFNHAPAYRTNYSTLDTGVHGACNDFKCNYFVCVDKNILRSVGNVFNATRSYDFDPRVPPNTFRLAVVSEHGAEIEVCALNFNREEPQITVKSEKVYRGTGHSYELQTRKCPPRPFSLAEILPLSAAKLNELARLNEELKTRLQALEQHREEITKLVDFIKEKLQQITGLDIKTITPELFKGYEADLAEIISLLNTAKSDLGQAKANQKQKLEQLEESIKRTNANLKKAAEMDKLELGLDTSAPPPIELSPLEDDKLDEFDPENNPYMETAKATIANLSAHWKHDLRREFLRTVEDWVQYEANMKSILDARFEKSPKEVEAASRAAAMVDDYLYKSGCNGQGCFENGGFWFRDSGISLEYRQEILAFASVWATLSRELGEIRSELNRLAYENALKELQTWKGPLSNAQQRIIEAFVVNSRTMNAFIAYSMLHKDMEVLEYKEALVAFRELNYVLLDAVNVGVQTAVPGVGDIVALCEIITGRELCHPEGTQLSIRMRAVTSLGMVLFSGKVWRSMAASAPSIAKNLKEVVRESEVIRAASKEICNGTRKLWEINRYSKLAEHRVFGKFYKDPKSDLWWSKDITGHGGSTWKVFKENSKGLEWKFDADEFGNFLKDKHKSDVGKFILWKDLVVKN